MIDRYLDELESELREAAGRRARLAVARAPRLSAGAVSVACALAVCLLVALAALQIAPARRAAGPSAPGVPAGARGLVGELAVFRRPQTAADRIDSPMPHLYALQPGLSGTGAQNLTVLPSLTRLVARLPGGQRIFLAIGRAAGADSLLTVNLGGHHKLRRALNPSVGTPSGNGNPSGDGNPAGDGNTARRRKPCRRRKHCPATETPRGRVPVSTSPRPITCWSGSSFRLRRMSRSRIAPTRPAWSRSGAVSRCWPVRR
jgi:hypothetical protein